ncbi:MAG: hypothetical protein EOO61_17845 [Hymenobacter sp.]|nr:MAG: hypothetical protein EOO61_17845 [Hymenobacter sp.]
MLKRSSLFGEKFSLKRFLPGFMVVGYVAYVSYFFSVRRISLAKQSAALFAETFNLVDPI